ncbi:MAG: hypothetical protein OEZ22_15155 [Spirochaetia bacterium]|nr:hypothetical protein [Spirochaetia bacterium]
MIKDEIKNIQSSPKELRMFGAFMAMGLSFAGMILYYKNIESFFYLFILSAYFFSGLITPVILLPFQKIWMSFFITINYMLINMVLSLIFYIIVFPFAFTLRLVKKENLDTKLEKNKKSYWNNISEKNYTPDSYKNQY